MNNRSNINKNIATYLDDKSNRHLEFGKGDWIYNVNKDDELFSSSVAIQWSCSDLKFFLKDIQNEQTRAIVNDMTNVPFTESCDMSCSELQYFVEDDDTDMSCYSSFEKIQLSCSNLNIFFNKMED